MDCVDGPEVPDIKITPPNRNSMEIQAVMETQTMEIIQNFPEPDRNGNLSPETPQTVLKRPRNKDFSKFNRSNRKSKNCATFYYKHVDTDSEQNPANMNAIAGDEEQFVSSEATSEEETWDYTNANATEMNGEDFNGNSLIEEDEEGENGARSITVRRLDFGEEMEEQRVPELEQKVEVVKICTKVSF